MHWLTAGTGGCPIYGTRCCSPSALTLSTYSKLNVFVQTTAVAKKCRRAVRKVDTNQKLLEAREQSFSLHHPKHCHLKQCLCVACIVYHDHNYSQHQHTHSPQPSPTTLTTRNVRSAVSLSPSTSAQPLIAQSNIGIQTDTTNQYFCIEDYANDYTAITLYLRVTKYFKNGFSSCVMPFIISNNYWGNKSSMLSSENRII